MSIRTNLLPYNQLGICFFCTALPIGLALELVPRCFSSIFLNLDVKVEFGEFQKSAY